MVDQAAMPRYDVRNDGAGPYATFYCDHCEHEYRSTPSLSSTIAQSAKQNITGGLLRRVPIFGGALANSVESQDPRYVTSLTPTQLQEAWKQIQPRFHQCPTCMQIVCASCWDAQGNTCTEDSPRKAEIAEAEAEQAAGVVKGFASVFGLGAVVSQAAQAAKAAQASGAKCPKDGTIAPAGTKFCPNCGSAMVQPQAAAASTSACPNCGADTKGAKFCPECGTKMQAVEAKCANCGVDLKGAKFCPECGTKA